MTMQRIEQSRSGRQGEVEMAGIWIIGRKVTLSNGHEYLAEPLVAFETNEDAQAACDMIQNVSGERPGITDGALYRKGETMRPVRQ